MYIRRDASFPHTEFLPLSRSGVKSRLKWSRVLKVKQQCYELRVRVFLRRLPVRWTNELESVWPNLSNVGSIWQLIWPKMNNWMIQNCPITLASVELLTKYLLEGAIFAKMTDFVHDQIKFCTKFDIFELQTWPNLGNFTPTDVNIQKIPWNLPIW